MPALDASLALLAAAAPEGPYAAISLYGTTRPVAGDPPGAAPVVTLPLTAAAGVVDAGLYQLQLATPIEAAVTGADPTLGTIPLWARITTPAGAWWADASVTVIDAGGEIQLDATGTEGDPAVPVARLFNGAYARLTSAVFQG
ncbi:MAG: hypothetical protein OQL08_09205 [Gammaproteobacteria bacterium]|nr:hypothetical protein [Gammaproteobacteria bacterium]